MEEISITTVVGLAGFLAGVVFGIVQTVVKPPAIADAQPVSIVSSCLPLLGSRKCTWMSIRPGEIIQSVQSMVSPSKSIGVWLICATTPCSMSTSPIQSKLFAESMIRPFCRSIVFI